MFEFYIEATGLHVRRNLRNLCLMGGTSLLAVRIGWTPAAIVYPNPPATNQVRVRILHLEVVDVRLVVILLYLGDGHGD